MKRLLLTSIIVLLFAGCSTNSTKSFMYQEQDRPEGSYQILKGATPFYSAELRKKSIEGWVIVQFSLDETGKVDFAEVYKEYPVGVFSDSAIRSVRESIYKPTVKDGIPQRTDGLLRKVNFKMSPSKKALENTDCGHVNPDYPDNYLCRPIK